MSANPTRVSNSAAMPVETRARKLIEARTDLGEWLDWMFLMSFSDQFVAEMPIRAVLRITDGLAEWRIWMSKLQAVVPDGPPRPTAHVTLAVRLIHVFIVPEPQAPLPGTSVAKTWKLAMPLFGDSQSPVSMAVAELVCVVMMSPAVVSW